MKEIILLVCHLQHRAPVLLLQSCHECKGLWHGGESPAKNKAEQLHLTASRRCPGPGAEPWHSRGRPCLWERSVPAADGRRDKLCGPALWACPWAPGGSAGQSWAALPRGHGAPAEGRRDGGMEGRGAGSAQTPPPLPLPALSIPRLSPISRPRVFSKCEPKSYISHFCWAGSPTLEPDQLPLLCRTEAPQAAGRGWELPRRARPAASKRWCSEEGLGLPAAPLPCRWAASNPGPWYNLLGQLWSVREPQLPALRVRGKPGSAPVQEESSLGLVRGRVCAQVSVY